MRRTEPGTEYEGEIHAASVEMEMIRGQLGTHSLAIGYLTLEYDASTRCNLTGLHDTTCRFRS